MTSRKSRAWWLLAVASWLAPIPAWSQKGMWAFAIHVCTEAGQCTEGVMTKKDSPVFVSKAKCEDGAQGLVEDLRRIGMVIKYVRCVQL